jgi:hypothetical protein
MQVRVCEKGNYGEKYESENLEDLEKELTSS